MRSSSGPEMRAQQAALVLGDGAGRAGAGLERVAVIAARAGVHGGDQYIVFIIGTGYCHLRLKSLFSHNRIGVMDIRQLRLSLRGDIFLGKCTEKIVEV